MRNIRKLAVRIDDESYWHIATLSLAVGLTYGDIIRHALNVTYGWDIPLTRRKGHMNYLPKDN